MKENEYSFEVKNLIPYIEYCGNNGYELVSSNKQQRIIYRHPNSTMARVTIIEKNGKAIKELDFKESVLSTSVLHERKESLPINFDDEKAIKSILDFLGYKRDNTLIRTRVVFKKGRVKLELDDYEFPRKAFIVAVEGTKEQAEKVYNEIRFLEN